MIEIKNLSKRFYTADGSVDALKNISLNISKGDIFGIIGMSGAGKSTLVRCMNMLEKPDNDSIVKIDGVNICDLSEKELRKIRRDVTMIFQGFNLLMQRNCLKNVAFPLELAGVGKKEAEAKAYELLKTVGLEQKAKAYPAQLSGGQQQRVAIARALATNPKVLLCDEATSALDPATTNSILELIRDINKQMGITVVIITHQMSVVEKICNNVAIMDNGTVVEQGNVTEIFSHPKSKAAQKLVFPDAIDDILSYKDAVHRLIRVIYNGSTAASSPLIAKMAIEKGVEANIVSASTKSIGGKVYGSMLLSVENDDNAVKTAIDYISLHSDIIAEEVLFNV